MEPRLTPFPCGRYTEAALAYARLCVERDPAFFTAESKRLRAEREENKREEKEKARERRAQEEQARQEKAARRAVVLQARAAAKASREVEGVVDWLVRETERAVRETERAALQEQQRNAAVVRKQDAEIAKVVRKVVLFLRLRTVRAAEAEAKAEAEAERKATLARAIENARARKAKAKVAKQNAKARKSFVKARRARALKSSCSWTMRRSVAGRV